MLTLELIYEALQANSFAMNVAITEERWFDLFRLKMHRDQLNLTLIQELQKNQKVA